MKPQKWNTTRIALCGAAGGGVYMLATLVVGNHYLDITENIAANFGGAVGGAALFATVSRIRNMFIR
jgi:hypothetical protein